MDRRRQLGVEGEAMALHFLESQGLILLARNYRCRIGELDLVLKDHSQIVFVEVRTKSSQEFGTGLESITFKKRSKLKLVAQHFMACHDLQGVDIRFDVISICKPSSGPSVLEHVKGAF